MNRSTMHTSTTSNPHNDRLTDAAHAAAARSREASIAREGADAATRAEQLAAAAHDAATAAAAAAEDAHAKGVEGAERAEAAWNASQTAAAWQNVERTRALRDQADVRAKATAAARESAALDLHTARGRSAAAAAEVDRAQRAEQRAADVLAGLRSDVRAADDAAAAREGARLRAVAHYRAERDAFAAVSRDTIAPMLRAAVDLARDFDASVRALDGAVNGIAAAADRILAAGRSCGDVGPQPPDVLAPPRSGVDLLGAALVASGLGGGALSPLARVSSVSPAGAVMLAAAGVEGEAPPVETLGALWREANALAQEAGAGMLAAAAGDVMRGEQQGATPQPLAFKLAGALLRAADGVHAEVMYNMTADKAPSVDRALALSRRLRSLADRVLSPGVWRW
jgi:hypothetical protein